MRRRRNRRAEKPAVDDGTFKPLLNAVQVAARLNVSKSQAYALMRQGEMTIVRLGNNVRVTEEDLLAYIEAQKRPSRPTLKLVGTGR